LQPVPDPIRFIIRLAVACHNAGVEFDVGVQPLTYNFRRCNSIKYSENTATVLQISVYGPVPPVSLKFARSEPKPKQEKAKGAKGECRLNVLDAVPSFICNDQKRRAGAVAVHHPCGLSVTAKSSSMQLGTCDGDADPKGKVWGVTHRATGLLVCHDAAGLSFDAARKALVKLADLDWTFESAGKCPHENCKRIGELWENSGNPLTRIA
jgi:hypothetical protein